MSRRPKRPRPNQETTSTRDDGMFMQIAEIVSKQSEDPDTKVGAVIVDENGSIVSTGYNHMPRGCENFSWNRAEKYRYVIYAAADAIMNSKDRVRNCKLYVTLCPSNNCAKLIIQAGISEVVYLKFVRNEDYQHSLETVEAMFKAAKITFRSL